MGQIVSLTILKDRCLHLILKITERLPRLSFRQTWVLHFKLRTNSKPFLMILIKIRMATPLCLLHTQRIRQPCPSQIVSSLRKIQAQLTLIEDLTMSWYIALAYRHYWSKINQSVSFFSLSHKMGFIRKMCLYPIKISDSLTTKWNPKFKKKIKKMRSKGMKLEIC